MSPPERYHGDGFNRRYEEWAREVSGGRPGSEYLVERGDRRVYFDTRSVEERGGELVEVLVDAKGRYAQFIDPDTGDWYDFFGDSRRSGLGKLLERARDQVDVADGRPVEWWCAEPEPADLFNEAFEDDDDLRNRIRAAYRPMPDERSGSE